MGERNMEMEMLRECERLVPLGFWLDVCEKANVPHVPAEFSRAFPVREIWDALDGSDFCSPGLDGVLRWCRKVTRERIARGERVSARWECCSSEEAKSAAARGAPWGPPYYELTIDDPRVVDCTVGGETRVCVRPWVEALRIEGYPLEWRVFVGPEGWLGTSSYYPQRALGGDSIRKVFRGVSNGVGKFNEGLMWVREYSARLRIAGEFPLGFSADFVIQRNGRPVFLEGGPPSLGLGEAVEVRGVCAHPCCFAPGEIEGIALEMRPGALKE